jgi:predicted nucleotidyltransferase
MNRWRDWWDQSARDLAHARHALEAGDFEWAAFAAQQAAEKALKTDSLTATRANCTREEKRRAPLPTRRSSSTSAGATYFDRERRLDELRLAATRARGRNPAIRRVVLFGSLAAGTATPRSDADLLIIVDCAEHPEGRDRVSDMLAALSPLPCPIDLVVLTGEEFERARQEQAPILREALSHGIDLL